jgi:hypothetical protein
MTLASGDVDSYLSRQQAFGVISGHVSLVVHVGQDVEVCYLLVPGDDVVGFHLRTKLVMLARRLTHKRIILLTGIGSSDNMRRSLAFYRLRLSLISL